MLEIRRVQVTGGNSFVVSLPKSWVKDIGLKAKDSVLVLPQADMSLLIVPKRELAEAEKSEATIEITQEMDKDAALRLFISYYLAGYDIVRLRSPKYDPWLRSYMREAIRRTIHKRGTLTLIPPQVHLLVPLLLREAGEGLAHSRPHLPLSRTGRSYCSSRVH